ncbi:CLUMA_CG021183, isoform A [Clunio marinus]|uniref:CLUMA_CG021183, isoform A n=1 Tax=Clunio marinus TaxID=568069 RepID=A0A1J1J8R1_9DIPT|nr:CLUMA_CG021183, isoform A [Clunio marinus]
MEWKQSKQHNVEKQKEKQQSIKKKCKKHIYINASRSKFFFLLSLHELSEMGRYLKTSSSDLTDLNSQTH